MACDLQSVPAHLRPYDLWPLMVCNFLAPEKPHKDYEDYSGGLCVAIPLGIFNGGELFFEELNLTIPVHNGDLVMFRSDLLTHQVLPFEGLRMSVLFLTHHRFMRWIKKDKTIPQKRSVEELYHAIDDVVNWGNNLKSKAATLQEQEELEANDDVVSWPRVNGHNPSEQLNDGYPDIEIPDHIQELVQERQGRPKKKCKNA